MVIAITESEGDKPKEEIETRIKKLEEQFSGFGKTLDEKLESVTKPLGEGVKKISDFFEDLMNIDDEPDDKKPKPKPKKKDEKVDVEKPEKKKFKMFGKVLK